MSFTEILPYGFRVFLDAIKLDFLPEKHCLPVYGFSGQKSKAKTEGNSQENSEENTRNVRAGFKVDKLQENEVVKSAWIAEKYDKQAGLTQDDIKELNRQGLSLSVAKVIKIEKVLNGASNRSIVAAHHVTGRTDGFGKSTVDKIAAIVAPSTNRGVKS